jgi:hypothetical protein
MHLNRLLSVATLLLAVGCASGGGNAAMLLKDVPAPATTPFDTNTEMKLAYIKGYREGYVIGHGGKMVMRHFKAGYEPNAGEQGWRAGNTAGFLAHLQKDGVP